MQKLKSFLNEDEEIKELISSFIFFCFILLILYFILITYYNYENKNDSYYDFKYQNKLDNRDNDYRYLTKKQKKDILEPNWWQNSNNNDYKNKNEDDDNIQDNKYILYEDGIKYIIDNDDNTKYILDDNNNKTFIYENETDNDYDLEYQNILKKIVKENNNKSKYGILYSDI